MGGAPVGGMIYRARMVNGTGIASRMHDRRIDPIQQYVGACLHRGTLNLSLDKPFDWAAPHEAITVPDAKNWQDLDGPWFESVARVYPVLVGYQRAWVMRLDRSSAPANTIEVVAPVRLRDVVETHCIVRHA